MQPPRPQATLNQHSVQILALRGSLISLSWRGGTGKLAVSAAGFCGLLVPIRGPGLSSPILVTLTPTNPDAAFTVRFLDTDRKPAADVCFETSFGRTIRSQEDGQLNVTEALLSELPLHVSDRQPYFPVQIPDLSFKQTIVLPPLLALQLVITGGVDDYGYQIHREWIPDIDQGFEIPAADWSTDERITALIVPADTPCTISAADGLGSFGRVELAHASAGVPVTLNLAFAYELELRLIPQDSDGRITGSTRLIADVEYLNESDHGFELRSHLLLHSTVGGIVHIPRPSTVFRLRIVDVSRHYELKLRRKTLGPIDDARAAGAIALPVFRKASTTVRLTSTTTGKPLAGMLLVIDPATETGAPSGTEAPTGHSEWLVMPPDRQEIIVGGDGKAEVLATPGWYRIRIELPPRYREGGARLAFYENASVVVHLPGERPIELSAPPMVFRDIEVHEKVSDMPVSEFQIHGPNDLWTTEVDGARWNGWTREEKLTIIVPGLGFRELPANAAGHIRVEVAAGSPCVVWCDGIQAEQVTALKLVTLDRESSSVFIRTIELDRVQEGGRVPIFLPPGTRFRLEIDRAEDTVKSPVFEWRGGASYRFPIPE